MDGKGTRRTETSRVVCHERARGVLLPNFDSKKHVCPNDSAPLSVYTIARAPALVSRTSQSSGGIGRIEMGGGGRRTGGALGEKEQKVAAAKLCPLSHGSREGFGGRTRGRKWCPGRNAHATPW